MNCGSDWDGENGSPEVAWTSCRSCSVRGALGDWLLLLMQWLAPPCQGLAGWDYFKPHSRVRNWKVRWYQIGRKEKGRRRDPTVAFFTMGGFQAKAARCLKTRAELRYESLRCGGAPSIWEGFAQREAGRKRDPPGRNDDRAPIFEGLRTPARAWKIHFGTDAGLNPIPVN